MSNKAHNRPKKVKKLKTCVCGVKAWGTKAGHSWAVCTNCGRFYNEQ